MIKLYIGRGVDLIRIKVVKSFVNLSLLDLVCDSCLFDCHFLSFGQSKTGIN